MLKFALIAMDLVSQLDVGTLTLLTWRCFQLLMLNKVLRLEKNEIRSEKAEVKTVVANLIETVKEILGKKQKCFTSL